MENVGIEDLQQILNYYKQKSSDLELQLLQMQLKFNKIASSSNSLVNDEQKPAIKTSKTKE